MPVLVITKTEVEDVQFEICEGMPLYFFWEQWLYNKLKKAGFEVVINTQGLYFKETVYYKVDPLTRETIFTTKPPS